MNSSSIFHVLVRHTNNVLSDIDEHQITRESSLADLGANSMERSEILLDALEELQITVSVTSFFGPKNLGELADKIESVERS
jgi:polyketide biosynthesis acyl carrier protein